MLEFEPLFAYALWGSAADAIAGPMRECGFDLSEAEDRSYALHTEASFALAERLTGVRPTARMLREAEFVCGTASLAV